MARTRARPSGGLDVGFSPRGPTGLGFDLSSFMAMHPGFMWAVSGLVSLAILVPLFVIFWDTLLETFGLAMAPVGVALLAAGIVAYKHPHSLYTRAHRWLSLIALGALTFGCMAFFQTEDGITADVTLGGNVGLAIIGSQNVLGVLRLIGIGIVTIYLAAPGRSWRVTLIGSALLFIAVSLSGRFAQACFVRIGDWYARRKEKHLIHTLSEAQAPPRWADNSLLRAMLQESAAREPASQDTAVLEPAESEHDPDETDEQEPEPEAGSDTLWEMLAPPRGEDERRGPDLPPVNLLESAARVELTPVDNQRRAALIEEALASHGIEARVAQINPGPAVTQFGVEPGWFRKHKEVRERDETGRPKMDKNGEPVFRLEEVSRKRVKVDQIAALDKDLALALAAPSIRIEAPVPGKSLVGIEVPNSSMGLVGLREALESPEFQKSVVKSKLALTLGKGSGGQMVVGSLAGMPHLLIAGATGSGKSVCITALTCCLLMHNSPDDVRFVMIDPKRVELVGFSLLPHLLTPVIVDMEKVVGALKWLTKEMDRRYKLLASASTRNIQGYNKKAAGGAKIPHLVVVIDELADLMSLAPFDVEQSLTRLAQMGRATGIHLIVATQRPSVNVITGLIKANFPTRISFAVTSMMDSRVILDTVGAEKLLGRGDMLYLPSDAAKPRRLQGVYVSEQEVERLVYFWDSHRKGTGSPPSLEELMSPSQASDEPRPAGVRQGPRPSGSATLAAIHRDEDPLFAKARALAMGHKSVSASLFQRRLGIGYPKAARLLDQLEEQGLVAPGDPGKSRKVLKPPPEEYFDD